jgi:anti-sigma regulatory factor (Ser/Thr protein kinase)
MSESVDRSFPALPSALYEVRKFIRDEAEGGRLSPSTTNDIILAVSEACANSVLHSGSTEMRVVWTQDADCVEVSVEDEGTFLKRVPIPELDRGHGHGIPLMMALMDEVSVHEGTERNPGTVVRLVKCRNR